MRLTRSIRVHVGTNMCMLLEGCPWPVCLACVESGTVNARQAETVLYKLNTLWQYYSVTGYNRLIIKLIIFYGSGMILYILR